MSGFKDYMENRYLKIYGDQSIEFQKKAKVLLSITVISHPLIVALTFLTLLMGTGIERYSLIPEFCLLFAGYPAVLIFLKYGKYTRAANLAILSNLLVGVAVSILRGDSSIEDLFYLSTVIALIFFIATLVGVRLYHVIQVTVIGSVAYLVIIGRLIFSGIEIEAGTLISSVVYFIFLCILSLIVFRLNNETIHLAQSESDKNIDKYSKIKSLADSFRTNVKVGENINHFTRQTIDTAGIIDSRLEEINESMVNMNEQMKDYKKDNNSMLGNVDGLRSNVETQSALISQSSAAIEEMTSSIKSISRIISDKGVNIEGLVATAMSGEDEMRRSLEAINRIEKSSADVLDVIKIIVNVAHQTNLLAMNAAIEAAHAGDAGRGFSVVADEIRKLSETTAKSTKTISSTLNNNINAIHEAVSINKVASEHFSQITSDIKVVDLALREVISNMDELSSSTTEINQAVADLLDSSGQTDSSVKHMKEIAIANTSSVNKIAETISINRLRIEEIVERFKVIINDTQMVNEIGKKNIKYILDFEKNLNEI